MKALMRGLLPVWFLLLAAAATAGTPPPIHFTASVSPSSAHPGEVVTVTVKASVDPGWHVYSVVPADNGPAATAIAAWHDGDPVGLTTEDAPQSQFDANFGRQVAYHAVSGTFQRQFRVVASPLAAADPRAYGVTIHYQTWQRQGLPTAHRRHSTGRVPDVRRGGAARVC